MLSKHNKCNFTFTAPDTGVYQFGYDAIAGHKTDENNLTPIHMTAGDTYVFQASKNIDWYGYQIA